MQGTPWHEEYLKCNDKQRRNISRCKYSNHMGKRIYICNCDKSPYYKLECHSCKNCGYYEEETK